jgi:hypothetical protein
VNIELTVFVMIKGKKSAIYIKVIQCDPKEIAHFGRVMLEELRGRIDEINLCWFELTGYDLNIKERNK